MLRGETVVDAALRGVAEELGVNVAAVQLVQGVTVPTITEMDSPSYPGLRTRYLLYPVVMQVDGLPDGEFWTGKESINTPDFVARYRWAWDLTKAHECYQ